MADNNYVGFRLTKTDGDLREALEGVADRTARIKELLRKGLSVEAGGLPFVEKAITELMERLENDITSEASHRPAEWLIKDPLPRKVQGTPCEPLVLLNNLKKAR